MVGCGRELVLQTYWGELKWNWSRHKARADQESGADQDTGQEQIRISGAGQDTGQEQIRISGRRIYHSDDQELTKTKDKTNLKFVVKSHPKGGRINVDERNRKQI